MSTIRLVQIDLIFPNLNAIQKCLFKNEIVLWKPHFQCQKLKIITIIFGVHQSIWPYLGWHLGIINPLLHQYAFLSSPYPSIWCCLTGIDLTFGIITKHQIARSRCPIDIAVLRDNACHWQYGMWHRLVGATYYPHPSGHKNAVFMVR